MGKSKTKIKRKPSSCDCIFIGLSLILGLVSLINLVFITSMSYYTPFILAGNVVLFVYWLFRWKKFIFVTIAAILSQLFFLPAFFNISSPYELENNLKVATFNAHYFKYNSSLTYEQVLSIMEHEGVDVICFQEFVEKWENTEEAFWNAFSHYPHSSVQNQDAPRTPRLAIFSKHPILSEDKELFKNQINSGMYIDIEYNGRIIRVLNCHFQTTGVTQNRKYGNEVMLENVFRNNAIRKQQADFVNTLINVTPYPIVFCGDFNDTPLSYTYRLFNRNLKDGFKEGGNGFGSTFTGSFRNLLRIDYIFHSKDFDCTQYRMLEVNLSDHKPVISSLEYKN